MLPAHHTQISAEIAAEVNAMAHSDSRPRLDDQDRLLLEDTVEKPLIAEYFHEIMAACHY